MVELTDCHMGHIYPMYLLAIPSIQVGKENRTGADLEPLFGFVQVDQVDGKLNLHGKAACVIVIGRGPVE